LCRHASGLPNADRACAVGANLPRATSRVRRAAKGTCLTQIPSTRESGGGRTASGEECRALPNQLCRHLCRSICVLHVSVHL
jgi:hypothetical protein